MFRSIIKILLILSKTVLREVSFGKDILPREHKAFLMHLFKPSARGDASAWNIHGMIRARHPAENCNRQNRIAADSAIIAITVWLPCLGGHHWLRTETTPTAASRTAPLVRPPRSPTRPRGGTGHTQAPRGRRFCRPAVRQAIQTATPTPTQRLRPPPFVSRSFVFGRKPLP